MVSRTKAYILLSSLLALESLARLLPSGLFRLLPAPLNYIDVTIGIAGIVSVVGLFFPLRWGYWGALAVSVMTIPFDIWGALTIYPTALLGIPVPALLLSYFVPRRSLLVEGASS
ncbi:MAG TPA: hypothetical protein VGR56_03345 [Nitrososphaerales archaeon]|nr:hypothetical protein [Nitrososphaerales archaeon]